MLLQIIRNLRHCFAVEPLAGTHLILRSHPIASRFLIAEFSLSLLRMAFSQYNCRIQKCSCFSFWLMLPNDLFQCDELVPPFHLSQSWKEGHTSIFMKHKNVKTGLATHFTIRENNNRWYLLKYPIFHAEIINEYTYTYTESCVWISIWLNVYFWWYKQKPGFQFRNSRPGPGVTTHFTYTPRRESYAVLLLIICKIFKKIGKYNYKIEHYNIFEIKKYSFFWK